MAKSDYDKFDYEKFADIRQLPNELAEMELRKIARLFAANTFTRQMIEPDGKARANLKAAIAVYIQEMKIMYEKGVDEIKDSLTDHLSGVVSGFGISIQSQIEANEEKKRGAKPAQ